MKALLLAFFDICRLRKAPQDIPASPQLLALSLTAYALLSCLLQGLSEPVDLAVSSALLEIAVLMLFVQCLLLLKGRPARWMQTMTALAGAGVILRLIVLPLYLFAGVGSGAALIGYNLGLTLLLMLVGWGVVVMAHILRHALETHPALAFMLALVYLFLLVYLTLTLLPPTRTYSY